MIVGDCTLEFLFGSSHACDLGLFETELRIRMNAAGLSEHMLHVQDKMFYVRIPIGELELRADGLSIDETVQARQEILALVQEIDNDISQAVRDEKLLAIIAV